MDIRLLNGFRFRYDAHGEIFRHELLTLKQKCEARMIGVIKDRYVCLISGKKTDRFYCPYCYKYHGGLGNYDENGCCDEYMRMLTLVDYGSIIGSITLMVGTKIVRLRVYEYGIYIVARMNNSIDFWQLGMDFGVIRLKHFGHTIYEAMADTRYKYEINGVKCSNSKCRRKQDEYYVVKGKVWCDCIRSVADFREYLRQIFSLLRSVLVGDIAFIIVRNIIAVYERICF